MGVLNHHSIDNCDVEVHPSGCQFECTSDSVPDPDTTPIKSIDYDEMYQLLKLFHSEHEYDILGVDIYMRQDLIVVAPSSKMYTFYNVLFHKYGGANDSVKNCI